MKVFRFELIALLIALVFASVVSTPPAQVDAAVYWSDYGRTFGLGGAPDLGKVESLSQLAKAMKAAGDETKALSWVQSMIEADQSIANAFTEATRRTGLSMKETKLRVARAIARNLIEGKVRHGNYKSGHRSLLVSSSKGMTDHREFNHSQGLPSDGNAYLFEVNEAGVHLEGGVIWYCGNLAVDVVEPLPKPREQPPEKTPPQATLPNVPPAAPIEVTIVGGQAGAVNDSWQLPVPVNPQVIIETADVKVQEQPADQGEFSVTIEGTSAEVSSAVSTSSSSAVGVTGGGGAAAGAGNGSASAGSAATVTTPTVTFTFRPNQRR